MKRKSVLFVCVLITIVTLSCVPRNDASKNEVSETTESYCEGVSKIIDQPMEMTGQRNYGILGASGSFIVIPPPGCDLPLLYCIYIDGGYDGGPSCVKLEE